MVELLSLLYLFNPINAPLAEMNTQTPQAQIATTADIPFGFTIKLEVDLDNLSDDKPLFEIPDFVSLVYRNADPNEAITSQQNYRNYRMPDDSIPILEATLLPSSFRKEWNRLPIGVPLKLLKDKGLEGVHEIVLNFTGAHWRMYVDGELMDEEFPFGLPKWEQKPVHASINPKSVTSAAVYSPPIAPVVKRKSPVDMAKNIQYWTPTGHNAWVGDVVTLYHDGRFHIYYLRDRRHHGSRFGTGGHYFEHLSTTDFKHWVEHEAAVPIDEQWESIGTGTPFVYKGKVYLAYGLHTSRIYPWESTMAPTQRSLFQRNGKTPSFVRADTPGMPIGSTYSVSDDGIHFTKSQIIFHYCENPSVFIDPDDGSLKMFANSSSKGTWTSNSLDGDWRLIDPDFPQGRDCTFPFRWGKYDYVIGGFAGMWYKPVGKDKYVDLVAQGLDCYDGLGVPAVTVIDDNRCVMTGWTGRLGWGGHLVLRELIQFPDGRLGSKWMKEVTPETGPQRTLVEKVNSPETSVATNDDSFLLTFDVSAADMKAGRLAVIFHSQDETDGPSEFQLNLKNGRAQWNDASPDGMFAADMKSVREGGPTNETGNYAIENLIGVDKPFQVRLLVTYDTKMGGSLIDAEIAGQRTMITGRVGLRVEKLIFRTEGVELRNVKIAPLK